MSARLRRFLVLAGLAAAALAPAALGCRSRPAPPPAAPPPADSDYPPRATKDGAGCAPGLVPLADGSGCGPRPEFRWVRLPAGTLTERWPGPDGAAAGTTTAVAAFDLARTETTVGEYRACVDAGACPPPPGDVFGGETHPDEGRWLNWAVPGRADHPVNGVNWDQARRFCAWIGGRLPTGAEWEYAARSAGKDQPRPWGTAPATCERAVMDEGWQSRDGEAPPLGCGANSTQPVCSRPAGNSAQGVCDLIGNVWEWHADPVTFGFRLEEDRLPDTVPAPVVGRGARGGSWDGGTIYFDAADRYACDPAASENSLGFRCARTP